MPITTITLPNGATVETTAPVSDLLAILQPAPAATPVRSTESTVRKSTAKVAEKVAAPAKSTKSTAAAKPKAEKPARQPKADMKPIYAEIARLEREGTQESLLAATNMADDHGWVQLATRLASKRQRLSDRAAPAPTKSAPAKPKAPAKSTKSTEKVGGEVKTVVERTAKQVAAEVPAESPKATAKPTVAAGQPKVKPLGERLNERILRAVDDCATSALLADLLVEQQQEEAKAKAAAKPQVAAAHSMRAVTYGFAIADLRSLIEV